MLKYASLTLARDSNIEKGRGGQKVKIWDWKTHAFNETGLFRGVSQLFLSMIVASAGVLLDIPNNCHSSTKVTLMVERNSTLPFIGVELLKQAPRIKTKVYVKPTNTGLVLHYQSHGDNRYKHSVITTMLDRAYRISSDWSYFSQEWGSRQYS